MITFEWVDRNGVLHELSSPTPIEEEADAISGDIDQVLGRMENASADRKSELRLVIQSHCFRLQQLQEDVERWNCHAHEQTDADAVELVEYIEKLLIEVQPMLIIALLYREHEKVMTDTENRDQILDGEMTRAQRTAVARSTVEPKPSRDATRREVHEWLKGDPKFHRPRTDESGWFEWHDADGVMHRLLSPRRIEQEIADIAHHLRPLLPALRGVVSQKDKAQAVETANPAMHRLSVLKVDLERYAREQKEREENEWHVWETERRRSREAQ